MPNTYKIYVPFLFIWIAISALIAYQAQFISDYLVHVRGMTQEEYEYPTKHIITLCTYLGLLFLNEIIYLSSRFTQQHPITSYFLCSILPLLFSVAVVFNAMHAPNYYFTFLLSILITTLFQLFFAPIMVYIMRQRDLIRLNNRNINP